MNMDLKTVWDSTSLGSLVPTDVLHSEMAARCRSTV